MDRSASAECPKCHANWPVFEQSAVASVENRARRPTPPALSGLQMTEALEMLKTISKGPKRAIPEDLADAISAEYKSKSTVLILAANPNHTDPLRLDREQRGIQDELERSPHGRDVEVLLRPAMKIEDLQYHVLNTTPAVLHFCGHGNLEGIALENEVGDPVLVPGTALAELLSFPRIRACLRLVVLNACLSAPQAELIASAVDGMVVGMSAAVGDEPAIEFARGLYGAIGQGADLNQAFMIARNRVRLTLPDAPAEVSQAFARRGIDTSHISAFP